MSAHNIISILWDLGRFNCKHIQKNIYMKAFGWYFLGWLHLSSLKGDESSQFALVEQKKSDWGQKFFLYKQLRPNNFQFINSSRNLLQGTVTTNQQSLKLNQTKRLQPKVKEKWLVGKVFSLEAIWTNNPLKKLLQRN